jgi:phosphohistidine phosphatase SixA
MKLLILSLFLISAAALAQDSGKIFVVRHAEKESNAADTPLSSQGRARAQCLAETLKDAHISAVLTTQYIRTKQTAEPTANQAHAQEESFDAKSLSQIATAAREAAKNGNVLIVGHSNTIPQLMLALGAASVTIPDTAYDQLFILNAADPKQLITVHYCPLLPTDAIPHPQNSMAK